MVLPSSGSDFYLIDRNHFLIAYTENIIDLQKKLGHRHMRHLLPDGQQLYLHTNVNSAEVAANERLSVYNRNVYSLLWSVV